MKFWIVFFVLFASLFASDLQADTIVYVVRHAEKKEGKDPVLNADGQKRAKDLARTLRSAEIQNCFASEFKRTIQTAKPSSLGKKITQYKAGNEKDLVSRILALQKDQTVLVVGHSNTVPQIIRLLGVENSISINEKQYDNLFVVKVDSKKASLLRLHYGNANPK